MAVNENVNKVVYGNSTLIDLTNDTVVPEALVDGYTAHDRSGATVTGTLELPSSSNPLPVEKGGTNANTASGARTNLDVYSKSEVTNAIAQSTAWANNWLTNTSILAYAASVANPSFTTFRTSATSTDVPIAKEYYIGTVERYGQNITVKMTTMQDASKMYINNSINGGSTWTGWYVYTGIAV